MRKKYALVERYIRNEKTDCLPGTREQIEYKLSGILEELEEKFGVKIGERGVTGLDGLVVSDWRGMIAEKYKPASFNNAIMMLKPFLRWLSTTGLTPSDYGVGLRPAKIPSVEMLPMDQRPKDKYLTHDQAKSLLECATGRNRLRDRAIIALILYTGLRTCEVASLNVGAFRGPQAKRGVMEVRRKGGMYKNVPIPDACYPYIDAYLDSREPLLDTDPLFVTRFGGRCNEHDLYRAISSKQKGVGDLATGGHALRHTFVSEIEKIGGAGVARDLANHHSLAVTNRYTHTTAEQRASAAQALAW